MEQTNTENQLVKLLSPTEIRAHLDEYVIGQDDAKRVLSVAVYNHYKRINYNATESKETRIDLQKSNVLMIGPTGTGKTYLATTIAKCLNVPIALTDATAYLTAGSAGFVGEDILQKLLKECNYDVKLAERGIVYIDEIDKIAKKDYNKLGEGVQQALLKIVEGTVASVPIQSARRMQSAQEFVDIDTSNILFIAGGAFVGLEAIVQMRLGGSTIGLLEAHEILRDLTPGDIAKFGMIPEFVGRMPVHVLLKGLDRAALSDILTKPKNSLVSQYKKMFQLDGIELEFEDSALEKVADIAIGLKTGARGLRTIMEGSMRDIMYTAPSEKGLNKIVITSDVIKHEGKAKFEYVIAKEDTEPEELPMRQPRDKYAFAD